MTDLVDRVALAMKRRAAVPLHNLESLEDVLVGCLGDAWPYLAEAAIAAMREPTEAMMRAGGGMNADEWGNPGSDSEAAAVWDAMIDAALKE